MRIGIDLGGTKTEIIVLDRNQEIYRKRVPTPTRTYEETVHCLRDLVKEFEGHPLCAGHTPSVGIGIPGTLSAETGLVKNANSTQLIGHPLDRDLEAAIGRPVRIANDANCFALSEATDGAAAGADVVFGVILGTGCGGGLVVGGRPLIGANGIAGEWGHNPLPNPSPEERAAMPVCYCGRTGCIETWISGTGFAADYARTSGHTLTGKEIAARAAAGETAALEARGRLEARIARCLAGVVNIVDPDCIVLGGGLANLPDLAKRLAALWHPWIFSDTVRTRLCTARHGDSSGVRGAAWLWPETGS